MPMHENLERKRRQNIAKYHASGACHLCECTSGSRSFCRFISDDEINNNNDDTIDRTENQQEDEEDSESFATTANEADAPPSNSNDALHQADANDPPPMRSCMCYGNSDWPYPLRVCEMCIADDLTTGRIRHCAICNVVACDEDCGAVELVEVTDREEWNNAGCLECRGMESFSEMELFRRRPYPNGIPRATRICTGCIELFSLFSFGAKYHFTCRYFKCPRLLVPSHVVELKRFLRPFPASLLPEELMNSIVDFLGGRDLFSFGMVCTSMFRKVEHVSMDLVTRFNDELPTGPAKIIRSENRNVVYAEGKNRHSLQAPDDGKTWVSVLNQMEQLTRDIFYLGFQVKGGDDGAAMRYLRQRDKIKFDCAYSKGAAASAIAPYFETGSLSVRGGQVLVTKFKWHHNSLMEEREDRNGVRSVIFSTDRVLASGIHRVIVRYNCFCEGDLLGFIGILRHQSSIEGQTVTWAQSSSMACIGRTEEHVFGMEYDADRRTLSTYKKNGKTNKMESTPTDAQTMSDGGGTFCFAAALSSGSVGIKGNQLSIRACSEDEWSQFLSHTVEKNIITRIPGRSRQGADRLMRYLDHRARRAMVEERGDNGLAARVEVEHMMENEMEGLNNDDSDSEVEDAMQLEGGDPPVALPPNVLAAPNPPGPM
mmetsp:Transcript_3402/g.6542  ORF Transcript_3402/g.6542 Transcript_3402/m.6542 type:complete len:655 (-) Transcript_3402:147-2111(-)